MEASEPVEFEATEIWSPSRSTWEDEGKNPELYVKIDSSAPSEAQGFILAVRRDILQSVPRSAEAADRVVDSVAAALNGTRRVVFDRGWNEKRVLGVIGQNPLDYASSQTVMEWAKWHPAAHVDSFNGRAH